MQRPVGGNRDNGIDGAIDKVDGEDVEGAGECAGGGEFLGDAEGGDAGGGGP